MSNGVDEFQPPNSQSEDWDYLNDDGTFSIISLPSGDGSPEISQNQPTARTLSEPAGNSIHLAHQPRPESPAPDVPQSRGMNRGSNNNRAIEKYGTNEPGTVGQPGTGSGGRATDVGSFDSPCRRADVLIKLLHILLYACALSDQVYTILSWVGVNGEDLISQLGYILDVLYFMKETRTVLSPGFYDWMGDLKFELLCIHTKLDGHKADNSRVPNTPESSLVKYNYRRIGGLRSRMDKMLSGIKSINGVFLSSPITDHNAKGPPLGAVAFGGGNAPYDRQGLSRLKDSIEACLDELRRIVHFELLDCPDQRQRMATLTLSYLLTKKSVDELLLFQGPFHHPSVVLDYYDYREIKPDNINALVLQLKEATLLLTYERTRTQNLLHKNDRSQYVKLAIGAPSMDVLCKTDEALVSIFRPIRKTT